MMDALSDHSRTSQRAFMQDRASTHRRIYLPRTPVHKDKKKERAGV